VKKDHQGNPYAVCPTSMLITWKQLIKYQGCPSASANVIFTAQIDVTVSQWQTSNSHMIVQLLPPPPAAPYPQLQPTSIFFLVAMDLSWFILSSVANE